MLHVLLWNIFPPEQRITNDFSGQYIWKNKNFKANFMLALAFLRTALSAHDNLFTGPRLSCLEMAQVNFLVPPGRQTTFKSDVAESWPWVVLWVSAKREVTFLAPGQ